MAEVVSYAGGRGVLLLCQSQETLNALSGILERAGEIVVSHGGLEDAWEQIKNGEVGCVVLDAESPAADTLAFFQTVRTAAKTCEIPFLFLIAADTPVPTLDNPGSEVAPDAWLVLPCAADQFLKHIRSLLNHKQRASLTSLMERRAVTVPAEGPAGPPAEAPVTSPEDLLAGPGAVFAGRLGVLDVTKIVSMVEPLRLTGVLRLSDGKRFGQVHFIGGAVRHAELHEIEGADALFLLFHLKTGTFRFDLEPETGRITIEGNTMALLLEGLRQMDEAKALVKSFKQRRAGASGHAPAPAPAEQSGT